MSLFLVILAAAAFWTVRAYFWPMAPCRRCKGAKTNKGSSKKRFGKCRRCKGSGTRWVLGSRSLHRAVRSGVKYRKQRRKDNEA